MRMHERSKNSVQLKKRMNLGEILYFFEEPPMIKKSQT